MVLELLPTQKILEFKNLNAIGIDRLHSYYQNCNYPICEYSVGVKQMWQAEYQYAFAEAAGCLFCRGVANGVTWFEYPVPSANGDIFAALDALEEYCVETETPLRFTTLPKEALPVLSERYDGINLQKTNSCRDYFYLTEEIAGFEGKKFAGQRNHIHKFQKLYPNAAFHKLLPNDDEKLKLFFKTFNSEFEKNGEEANYEKDSAFSALLHRKDDVFLAGCLEYEGRIIGVSMGEKCGNTMVIHIEKALANDFEGVYPMLFQSFVKMFALDCKFINREDDAQDMGLRISKFQYHPAFLSEKFDAEVCNPLHFVRKIPVLQGNRVTLKKLDTENAKDYLQLSANQENNRYWGYDCIADFGHLPTEMELMESVEADFSKKVALSFGIFVGTRMVGEAVLYRFDYRGGCEIGIRLFPQYQSKGYAKEALCLLSEWALYSFGITKLKAKCFLENTSSAKLLASQMKKVGEDEKMLYFERMI